MKDLTKFDRLMLDEAYTRCYGLRATILSNTRGSLETLAHQTGLRLAYLTEVKSAVIAHAEDIRSV